MAETLSFSNNTIFFFKPKTNFLHKSPLFPKYPYQSLLHSSQNAPTISCSSSTKTKPTPHNNKSLFSEGRDEDETRLVCPGCGVFMQDQNPNFPGFYQKPPNSQISDDDDGDIIEDYDEFSEEEEGFSNGLPSKSDLGPKIEGIKLDDFGEFSSDSDDFVEVEDEGINKFKSKSDLGSKMKSIELNFDDSDESTEEEDEEIDGVKSKSNLGSKMKLMELNLDDLDEFTEDEDSKSNNKFLDYDSDWDVEMDEEDESLKKELDGFTPAGPEYGNVPEGTLI